MKIENKKDFGSAYFAAIEDGKEIGEANYFSSDDNHISITHVGVEPKYRGQGKAKELVMGVVDYCRDHDIKVTPLCSYARAVFARHPEIHDVLYKE